MFGYRLGSLYDLNETSTNHSEWQMESVPEQDDHIHYSPTGTLGVKWNYS